MQKNVMVLHHNDRDGYVSAAIVYEVLKYAPPCNVQFKEVNYSKPLSKCMADGWDDTMDEIYILDYSINTEDDINFMIKNNEKIIWIDHHKSSIDTENEHPTIKSINGYRVVGISAAALCWLYFREMNSINRKFLENFMRTSFRREMPKDDVKALVNQNPYMPILVQYTHRYDIWDLDEEVIEFNFGYTKENIQEIARDIINSTGNDTFMVEYLNKGEAIKDYVIIEWDSIIKHTGKTFTLDIQEDCGEAAGEYRVLSVNMQRPSSLKFGTFVVDYDLVLGWFYDGECYEYSLRTIKPEIDCAKIAEVFGGGGHKAAAGFCLKHNFIEDIEDGSTETVHKGKYHK